MIDTEKLRSEFIAKYGGEPRIFRAPGRVNIIGEHTDYNDGFVMPCAIDFATYVAGSPRTDRRIRVASRNFEYAAEFHLDDREQSIGETWAKYVQGVALILERTGRVLNGADLLIDSDVPVGAGLSSSAALEVSIALTLTALSGHEVDGMELARIGQTAEHEFAGVRSGIMDQFGSVFGCADHALFLDCRSLEWEPVPVSSAKFIICNTKTKHDLADGEYNKRRAECEAAARLLGQTSLRDVSLDQFEQRSTEMPETLQRRARHIITENARVLSARDAFRRDDMVTLGSLINESHESLCDDFEVSCDELDLMVDLARSQNGVLGARMIGGGFGGCTINLLKPGDHREFAQKMTELYERETGICAEIYDCRIADGAGEVGYSESISK